MTTTHAQETPMTTDTPTVGETVMLPEYAVEIAELLAATEGHKDSLVRGVRKIAIQAAVALQQAIDALPVACRECGCTDADACLGGCSWVEPNLCSACTPQTPGSDATAHTPPRDGSNSTSEPEAPTPPPSGHLTVRARLLILGVDQPTVRAWCVANDVPVNAQGTIRTESLDAYEAAHTNTAA